MDYNDLAFAQACVRAINIVAAAAKTWMQGKVLEHSPKNQPKQETEVSNPQR